jgi:hypothetical protein
MNKSLKTLLLVGALGLGYLAVPNSANAEHRPYWRGYWGWYDSTYVPYQRYYYQPYDYGYAPSPNYYYSEPYYRGYYNNPQPRVGVQIGGRNRLNFGWW